ncbi:MAG: GxxExxY protein [Chloroflexi bacterium]|nr:GxxExxY protein [Chloroflexota bacterium]
MTKIIHKELSYTVRGVLFDVHNQLGSMLPEQFYQDAIAIGLEAKGIACQTEKAFEVLYQGVQVGRYFVDVWIEDGQLLLELKVVPQILPIHRAQAISYLKVTNADLAIVVNFGGSKLEDERLPNRLGEQTAVSRPQTLQPNKTIPYPELTTQLIQSLYQVHHELGAGFFHHVYRRATMIELQQQEIGFDYIKQMPVYYRNTFLGNQDTRLILIENCILLATVAVKKVDEAMKAQLRMRMRHLNIDLAILANFNSTKLDINFVKKEFNA